MIWRVRCFTTKSKNDSWGLCEWHVEWRERYCDELSPRSIGEISVMLNRHLYCFEEGGKITTINFQKYLYRRTGKHNSYKRETRECRCFLHWFFFLNNLDTLLCTWEKNYYQPCSKPSWSSDKLWAHWVFTTSPVNISKVKVVHQRAKSYHTATTNNEPTWHLPTTLLNSLISQM